MTGIFIIFAGVYLVLFLVIDKKIRERIGAEKRTYLQPDNRKQQKSRSQNWIEGILAAIFISWVIFGFFLDIVPVTIFAPLIVLVVFQLVNGWFQYRKQRERQEHVLSFYSAGGLALFAGIGFVLMRM
jgi:uncharacterized membrane protein YgcG